MPSIPIVWPPSLESYKLDLKLDADDARYDDALQETLDAAIAYVERVRPDVDYLAYDVNDPLPPSAILVPVTKDLIVGTLRLARRWDLRRDTPTGMLIAGAVGSTGLAPWDSDVEKLLRIGKYARIRFA